MRRDLLQWDQALTLADRFGTIYPIVVNPHSPNLVSGSGSRTRTFKPKNRADLQFLKIWIKNAFSLNFMKHF
jgi:hypothetical protein